MTKPDTTISDACGKRYPFTGHKDRCPFCCPLEDESEDYDLVDVEYDEDG